MDNGNQEEVLDAPLKTAKDRGPDGKMLSDDQADAGLMSLFGKQSSPSSDATAVDTSTRYRMDQNPRGIAIIINNREFLRSSGMQNYPRNGTDVDRDNLKRIFEKLLFDVRVYDNQRCYEIRRKLKDLITMDYSKYNAVIFAMLSHGEEGLVYGTDDKMEVREITAYFKGKTFAGKPKLFFFQACRGYEYMDGYEVTDGGEDIFEPDGPANQNKVAVPAEADFLYAYSTVPGYYSWRNSSNGSWFVQSITSVFERYADKMDVVRMLTKVNNGVTKFKSRTGVRVSNSKMQVSTIVSMLRKELYFFPEQVKED